jgi:small-conductance mechanosensitive channel/CRP-like cAMP-binding protein/tellurite resistance protein
LTGLSEFSGEIGLFAILASLTFFFVRVVYAFFGGRLHSLRNSFELLLALTITYVAAGPATRYVGLGEYSSDVHGGVAFLWWVTVAFIVNAALRRFVWEGVLSDHGIRRVPKLVTDGISVALYGLAVLIVMHFVYGEPVGAVLATSGAAALIVGLSAQSTIKEVFAGISLNATKALRLGDYVEIDGVYGQVFEINWRSIAVKNPHTDSLYIFPNSAVAERTVLNFSEPTGRFKYYVHFVAEVSAPPELVIRAVAEELENSRYVRRDPKPDFNLLGFTERGLEIRIRYFFDGDDPWWDAQNEVCMAIWSAMRKHNLRLAVNRTWMGSKDEWDDVERRVERSTNIETISSLLSHNELLSGLSDDDINPLVSSALTNAIGPPACVYSPGDDAKNLYLVVDGQIGIFSRAVDGTELRIDTCAPGEVFGLAGLLDHSAHRYLAQADQYSTLVCIDVTALNAILRADSDRHRQIQSNLSDRESRRAVMLEQARDAWVASQQAEEKKRVSDELRRGVDHFLSRPIFHHLFDSLTSATRHEDLLKAVMTGAALVCCTRGGIDEQERRYVRAAFARADLLRHLDFEHAMKLLEGYSGRVRKNGERARLLESLGSARSIRGGPEIVMAVCHGLTGVHGSPTQDEKAALRDIATVLDASEHIHELKIEIGESEGSSTEGGR